MNRKKKDEKKKKQKKSSSKADKIREQNAVKSHKKLIDDDMKRLEHYKKLKSLTPEIISNIKFLKTEYGKNRMKFQFLRLAYDNNDADSIIELYLQLIHVTPETKREEKTKKRVKKFMSKFDYKQYQFESLSNRLPPLDFYNDRKKELEPWQVQTLRQIEKGRDVIVCAKTSMGKTWMAMLPPLSGVKTLFIVPTRPLAYQVAAVFKKFLSGSTSLIVKDLFLFSENDTVFVGTPKEIEANIPKIGFKFKRIVCDEIHNLNYYNGDSYERLIKLYSKTCPILALSATIGNAETIQKWFYNMTGRKAFLMQHSTRFINLQRHIWLPNNTLEKIHPFSCLDIDNINDTFLNKNLPLTPYDNVQVYKALCDEFGKDAMNHLNLDTVFPGDNKRLTLDDSKKYEQMIKEELVNLKDTHHDKISNIIGRFSREVEYVDNLNLFNLLRSVKNAKLTPCIVFQLNKNYCKEIFEKVVFYLEKLESLNYPFHYENLEWQQKYFEGYEKKREQFERNMRLGKNDGGSSKEDMKLDKVSNFEERELSSYLDELQSRYQKQIKLIQKNESTSDKIKHIQLKNLEREFTNKASATSIKGCDIFEKHPDFCLNSMSPMSAEQIREIRKYMCKKLKIKIDYNNVFIQGLKRGIGIFTEDMPEAYNQTVQSLAQDKQLGFVISGRLLGLGINMPFKSAMMCGYKDSRYFSKEDYEQFIGRSGRRGYDVEGHIIYVNVDWKTLMKGNLGDIVGQKDVLYNYPVLEKISDFRPQRVNLVYKNFLNPDLEFDESKIETEYFSENLENRILWSLKEYNEATRSWLKFHDVIDMTFKKDKFKKFDILKFLNILLYLFFENKQLIDSVHIDDEDLSEKSLEISKQIKIEFIDNPQTVDKLYNLADIIRLMYNNYSRSRYYNNLKILLNQSFKNILEILNKNQCLNK